MRLQDLIIRQTQKAMQDILRAVEALPVDRRDWQPSETSRSALHQLQEVAMVPDFYLRLLESGEMPPMDDHARQRTAEIRAGLADYEACRQAVMASTAKLCLAIKDFPDERLDEEVSLPFGGGMMMTMAELLALHAWNTTYHLGQINYIQTMLGDRDMH